MQVVAWPARRRPAARQARQVAVGGAHFPNVVSLTAKSHRVKRRRCYCCLVCSQGHSASRQPHGSSASLRAAFAVVMPAAPAGHCMLLELAAAMAASSAATAAGAAVATAVAAAVKPVAETAAVAAAAVADAPALAVGTADVSLATAAATAADSEK